MSKELVDLVVDMREEEAVKLAEKLLEEGVEPLSLLDDCREALGIIGDRFAAGECFVPELILAGEMLRQIGALVKPRIESSGEGAQEKIGKIEFDFKELDFCNSNGFYIIMDISEMIINAIKGPITVKRLKADDWQQETLPILLNVDEPEIEARITFQEFADI